MYTYGKLSNKIKPTGALERLQCHGCSAHGTDCGHCRLVVVVVVVYRLFLELYTVLVALLRILPTAADMVEPRLPTHPPAALNSQKSTRKEFRTTVRYLLFTLEIYSQTVPRSEALQ